MRYDVRLLHRPACAYPDCGNEYEGEGDEWWEDPYDGFEQAWEDDWLVLDSRADEPVAICPEHLLYDADGEPVRHDPERNGPKTSSLKPFYEDREGEPLPEPDCEPGVLHALLHAGLVIADRPFISPVCEYPHCDSVFADWPFARWWYQSLDEAETAVHDSLHWAMLCGDDHELHVFCPEHVMSGADGRPVRVRDTVPPPALAERYYDPRLPAVRSDCVDGVLAVLKGRAS